MSNIRLLPDQTPEHLHSIGMIEAIAGGSDLSLAISKVKANLVEKAGKVDHCVAVYNVCIRHCAAVSPSGTLYTVLAYGSAVESRT